MEKQISAKRARKEVKRGSRSASTRCLSSLEAPVSRRQLSREIDNCTNRQRVGRSRLNEREFTHKCVTRAIFTARERIVERDAHHRPGTRAS